MTDLHENPIPRRGSNLAVERHGHAAVVTVDGDLDLVAAPQLKETLTRLLREGCDGLVLDFARVSLMDSTAVSVLIGVQRRLAPEQRLAIADAPAHVLRVLELGGVAATLRIFPSLDAALTYVEDRDRLDHPAPSPPLTADAALMLGLASTAMPFAGSEQDQAERWLRVLRRHGEAGAVLASLGVSEAAIHELSAAEEGDDSDRLAAVTEDAGRIASQRRAPRIATTDLLLAVMHEYGATFDRVLTAHGGDLDELAERLATAHPAAA